MTGLTSQSSSTGGYPATPPAYAWLGAVARFRQGAYRLLAEGFRPPTPEFIKVAPRAAGVLFGLRDDVSALAFQAPVEAWLRELNGLESSGLASLTAQYESVFGDLPAEGRVALLESKYRRQDASDPGFVVATLTSLYTHAGFRLAAQGGNVPDHVSVELEFASLMCREEASAWASGTGRRAMSVLVRQQLFFAQHLCLWVPLVARELQAQAGLYGMTARAAWAMVSHDVDFVRVSRAMARDAAPGRNLAAPD